MLLLCLAMDVELHVSTLNSFEHPGSAA
jgi:hypothetical protein